jgi:fumarate hydratase subunit alpha
MEQYLVKEKFTQLAEQILTFAGTDLPSSQVNALEDANEKETVTAAKAQLGTMLKNVEIAREKCSSICQDPGIPVFDLTIGSGFPMEFDIQAALSEATATVTRKIPLRQNICHPLTKINSRNNTGKDIPWIYYGYLPGKDYVEINGQLRGGGSGFRSMVFSLAPTAPRAEGIKKLILDHVAMAGGIPCPPTVIGVGLGGTPDIALKIAFDALMRQPVGAPNPEPAMAEIESQLYEALNDTGIGAMGLGGDTTVLGIHLDYCASHIATHPVAIAFSCWPNRFAKARLYADGRVEWLTHKEATK